MPLIQALIPLGLGAVNELLQQEVTTLGGTLPARWRRAWRGPSGEPLTLHRLGLFKELGRSFKTTNCIENVNALVGQRTDKVDCWRNADQKHRWLAATLLDIEPRWRKVRGHQHLLRLRAALQAHAKDASERVA